jgi:hypothetical protein
MDLSGSRRDPPELTRLPLQAPDPEDLGDLVAPGVRTVHQGVRFLDVLAEGERFPAMIHAEGVVQPLE